MFKWLSGLIASSIMLAPMMSAQAQSVTSFGTSTIAPRSSFGVYNSQLNPYGSSNLIISNPVVSPYYGFPGYYPPVVPAPVIITPQVRAIIVNPGYGNTYFSNPRYSCGTAIYGSPAVSPVLVNPYSGLACR